MSAIDIVLPRLQRAEGFSATKYVDTRGHMTIGYGFDVDAGISRTAAAALLQAQAQDMDRALQLYPWYVALDPVRQSVCVEIAFNAGLAGLVKGFPLMIAALTAKDWPEAAAQCSVQNPELNARYTALAQLLLTGGLA
jgi:lysozyme